jgi:hypothetical protein
MAIDQENKDFSNLIGRVEKFVLLYGRWSRGQKLFQKLDWSRAKVCHLSFNVDANSQKTMPSKTSTWQHFL